MKTCSNTKFYFSESEETFQTFLHKRNKVIAGRDLEKIDPWANPTFWNYFPPTMSCPFPSTRVGYLGDGGKWICGLGQIARKPNCLIYSFGVGEDSSFEDELLSTTNCSVFAFDPTVTGINLDKDKYPGRVHFHRIGLGVSESNSSRIRSLKEIMTERGHSWIDILKVDVEGAEFAAFEQIFADYSAGLPFGALIMELHLTEDGAWKTREEERKQFGYVWGWWRKLEKLGLRAWMSEVNSLFNYRSKIVKPWLIEYSYINVKHVLDRLSE